MSTHANFEVDVSVCLSSFFLQSENEDEKFSSARFTFFLSFSSSPFFLRWHIEINVNFFHTLAPYWFPKYPRARGGRGGFSKESKRVVIDCDDGAGPVESLFDNEIPTSFCIKQNWLR